MERGTRERAGVTWLRALWRYAVALPSNCGLYRRMRPQAMLARCANTLGDIRRYSFVVRVHRMRQHGFKGSYVTVGGSRRRIRSSRGLCRRLRRSNRDRLC